MKIIKKIVNVGNSVGIVFDVVLKRSLDVELGDEIEIEFDTIKKIKEKK